MYEMPERYDDDKCTPPDPMTLTEEDELCRRGRMVDNTFYHLDAARGFLDDLNLELHDDSLTKMIHDIDDISDNYGRVTRFHQIPLGDGGLRKRITVDASVWDSQQSELRLLQMKNAELEGRT